MRYIWPYFLKFPDSFYYFPFSSEEYMRQQIEAWLQSLSEHYERVRVSYLVALALLVILLGSLACSTKAPESAPPNAPAVAPSPVFPAVVTEDTKNPLTDLAAASQAGKPLYEKNCSFCHGVTGASDGTFVPKPPVINSGAITQAPDGKIFLVIKNGKGKSMPAMKRMTDEEIWQVVAYIRTFATQ